jgi:hypothetical protein
MKKMLFPFITILCLSLPAFAQDTLWTRTYGGGSDDRGHSFQQTADGGYIVVGETESFGAGNHDVYLIKIDLNGNTLWTRTYGGSSDDKGHSVQQTTDEGFILAGEAKSFGAGNYDMYLIKINSAGTILWNRTYGGSSEDRCYAVQQTADGGFILAGETNSFGAGGYDYFLVKTDSIGNLIWNRTYGGIYDDHGISVQQTTDGGYVLVGETESFGPGERDVYLIKTDSTGNILWSQTYGGSCWDWAASVQQTADGGYIVAGGTMTFAVGWFDVYLIKTDSSGNILWTNIYGGSLWEEAFCVRQTSDKGYILIGETESFGTSGKDIYLIRTDPAGNALWTRTYGGGSEDRGNSVLQTSDGGFIITGLTFSFGVGNRDLILIKLNSVGNSCMGELVFSTVSNVSSILITPTTVTTSPSVSVTTPQTTSTTPTVLVTTVCEERIVPRGDVNGDGENSVSDIVYLINYLFKNGPAPNPLVAGDLNCDDAVEVTDVVYFINYLFKNGPPPCQ